MVLLLVGVGGCGDDTSMTAANDLSMSTTMHDLSQPTTGGDMAKSSGDGGAGLLALCATCTQNSDCATGMCIAYMGGATKKCSHSCAAATATTDCPGIDACNGMNVCKCQ